jgi:hypothetical protein
MVKSLAEIRLRLEENQNFYHFKIYYHYYHVVTALRVKNELFFTNNTRTNFLKTFKLGTRAESGPATLSFVCHYPNLVLALNWINVFKR